MKHKAHALVATCIDFRLHKHVQNFLHTKLSGKNYDYVGHAGGVKELDAVMEQIDISVRLHDIDEVHLINHEDCGAYGEGATKEHHIQSHVKAKQAIVEKYPHLSVSNYFLRLDGTFEEIS